MPLLTALRPRNRRAAREDTGPVNEADSEQQARLDIRSVLVLGANPMDLVEIALLQHCANFGADLSTGCSIDVCDERLNALAGHWRDLQI